MESAVDLKVQQVEASLLQRGDFVFQAGKIWKCVNRTIQQFQEIEGKAIETIATPHYQRLETLQLAPRKWAVSEGVVKFEGQELGLGPTHNLQLTALR
jgi:hypothetical protein